MTDKTVGLATFNALREANASILDTMASILDTADGLVWLVQSGAALTDRGVQVAADAEVMLAACRASLERFEQQRNALRQGDRRCARCRL